MSAALSEEAGALRRGVMRLVAGKLAAGFGAWREMASQRKAMVELAGRCARRMRNASLSGAWNSWRSMAADAVPQQRQDGDGVSLSARTDRGRLIQIRGMVCHATELSGQSN